MPPNKLLRFAELCRNHRVAMSEPALHRAIAFTATRIELSTAFLGPIYHPQIPLTRSKEGIAAGQFSEGLSTRSITSILTGPCTDFNLRPNCSCTAVKRVGPLPSSPAAFARTRACTRVRHRICRSRPSYPAQAYPGKRKSNYAWRLRLNRPEAAPAPDGADFRVESIKGQVTAMRQKAHGRQQPHVCRELPLRANSLDRMNQSLWRWDVCGPG